MSHLHLVASSTVARSDECSRAPVRMVRARLQLVPNTGSLHRDGSAAPVGSNGLRVLAALLGLAAVASAGIAFMERGSAISQVTTPQPAPTSLAPIGSPHGTAELAIRNIHGSGSPQQFAKEYARWSKL